MKSKSLTSYILMAAIAILFIITCSCKKEKPITETQKSDIMYTNITNAKIAYKIYGSGEPLIMCTGYSANMDSWSTGVLDILQEKFKVIVFDYRGMGLSTNTEPSFTIAKLGDDVNELLNALNISKTHVLGWSMGGFVAQMFALNHPEKVNKLVIYASNCGDTISVNASQVIIDILSNPSATPMERLSTLFPDDWLATHPKPWTYLPEDTEPYNYETIGLQYVAIENWITPGSGSAGRLHELKMPVLLISGDEDKVVPFINSTILNDSIIKSTLIKVQGAGHGLMYQLPETFANYVSTFLSE